MSALEIRIARPGETEAVIAVLNEAATWLAGRGISGWTPGQWRAARIAAAIERGETFLAVSDGAIVGTFVLDWSDPVMWPDAADDAGYVHRLAVATGAHGRRIGHEMLRWAEARVAESGRTVVRLDCPCDRTPLHAYYEREGFVRKDDRVVRGRADEFCGSRFEKPIIR